jgi:citrate lyase subunit beta / citryl-CoA lyase
MPTRRPQEAFDRAAAILEELDCAAATNGRGAILIDGEMIDEAGRKQATQIVARGTAAGLMKT